MNIDIEKIVRENIDKTIHMSLATVNDNLPWVCELHFAYDNKLNLYYSSLMSRRHSQEISINPKVAGNIVRQHPPGEYPLGLYFDGQAKLLEDDEEIKAAFGVLSQQQGTTEQDFKDAKDPEKHRFYKITISNWYVFGKLDGVSGQKYQLSWNGGQNE